MTDQTPRTEAKVCRTCFDLLRANQSVHAQWVERHYRLIWTPCRLHEGLR